MIKCIRKKIKKLISKKKISAYLNEMLIFSQMCVHDRVERFSECVKIVFLFFSNAFKIDRLISAFEKKKISLGT